MDTEWNVPGLELEMFTDAGGSYANRYRLDGGIVYMPWDGYIGTPFARFKRGAYLLTLEAWGSKADEEFARIIVYSLKLENGRAKLMSVLKNIELGPEAAVYAIPFAAELDGIYKLRIQFYNNVGDTKERDRSVWISELKISSRKPE